MSIRLFIFIALLIVSFPGRAAVITVDVSSDGTGSADQCELRDAIVAANTDSAVDGCDAGSQEDLLVFDMPDTAILLNSPLPVIDDSLTIEGPGKDLLFINGDDSHPIFSVTQDAVKFTLRGVSLFQGFAEIGGCLRVQGSREVLVEDVRFDSCEASVAGGGCMSISTVFAANSNTLRRVEATNCRAFQGGGAASLSGETILVEDSLFEGNFGIDFASVGGAMILGGNGNAIIRRSTFWNNESSLLGSALHLSSTSLTVLIEHSTFSKNHSSGTNANQLGGAINVNPSLTLFNTVVAGNTEENPNHDNADILISGSGSVTTLGHNFIGNNEGSSAVFPAGVQANGDQAGTALMPLDPELGLLQDNGGPTRTALPKSGSRLIDQGSCPGELRDQRGFGNPATDERVVDIPTIINDDDGCDIGAVEFQAEFIDPSQFFFDGFE